MELDWFLPFCIFREQAPSNYREPDFQMQALQHSNVKLSWEDDEPKRKKVLRRKFNTDQLNDLEFKEFLASDNEDSDEYEDDECLPDGEIKKLKKDLGGNDTIEAIGTPDKVINAIGLEVIGENVEGRVLRTEVAEHSERTYYQFEGSIEGSILSPRHKFHKVFQSKQGCYSELPPSRISEMMKSNNLDNSPTQSLLSVVNGILDESIERQNGRISDSTLSNRMDILVSFL